jgi:YidC/Oxa1 family membrane protein insertase
MLAQIPVFLGLFHVLRSFNRTQTGIGQLGLSVEQNRSLGNYFFSATDVQNFLSAHLFGAPIGATMVQKHGLEAFVDQAGNPVFHRVSVIAVAVPIMILAGVATYFNSRASVARQSPEAAANPQTAMMNKLALYVFPLGVVVGGPFLPVAIIIYWLSNNIWTFGQQHYVFGKIEKEEEAKKELELARRAANAPAPGVKPNKGRKGGTAAVSSNTGGASDSGNTSLEKTEASKTTPGSPGPNQTGSEASSEGDVNRTPRPGARPKKRKR